MLSIRFRHISSLILLTLLPAIVIWYSFYFNLPRLIGFPQTSLETIFANYDGPNYMIIAKCGYQKSCIANNYSLPLPLEYYPAHLPGYPLLIKYFSLFTSTPKAMLLTSLLGSVFLSLVSFYFFKLFLTAKSAYWLSLVSVFFPARLMVLRLVGAPETWFIGFILLSVIYFKKKQFLWSAVFVSLAQLFKSPGILLLAAYLIVFLLGLLKTKKINYHYLYYLLVPLTVLGIFYSYYLSTGDFWAYFHSGDNFHLSFLPYQVFVSNHTWINTIWLEDVIYIFLIIFIGIYKLSRHYSKNIIFIFPLIFTLASVFIAHRDISRYIIPVYPFIFLAFAKFINRRSTKIILWLLLPAVILFTVNFLIGNTAPISNWAPYL